MSQHDLPLWARGAAAVLLIFASWWLVATDAIRNLVGDSVALVSLGVVAGSVLRGMHLPLGLWPSGPWRKEIVLPAVPLVAVAFAALIVLARPAPAAELAALVDRGTFVIVIAGVLAWSFTWAFVQQRSFLPWYVIAAVAGVLPVVVALVGLRVRGGAWPELCFLLSADLAAENQCEMSVLRAFVFLAVVGTATALVSVELAFRRLLIGDPKQAGLALILGAALIAGAWSGLMIVDLPALAPPWWYAAVGAVGAGCLYVLSGSLLVSGFHTAVVWSSYYAVSYSESAFAFRWELFLVHLLVALGLSVPVYKRKGLLAGIR